MKNNKVNFTIDADYNINGVPVNIENISMSFDPKTTVEEMYQTLNAIESMFNTVEKNEETKENDIESVWSELKNSGPLETGRCGEISLSYENREERDRITFYYEAEECIQLAIQTACMSSPVWVFLFRDPSKHGPSYCDHDGIRIEDVIESIKNEEVRKIVDNFVKKALNK